MGAVAQRRRDEHSWAALISCFLFPLLITFNSPSYTQGELSWKGSGYETSARPTPGKLGRAEEIFRQILPLDGPSRRARRTLVSHLCGVSSTSWTIDLSGCLTQRTTRICWGHYTQHLESLKGEAPPWS